MQSRDSNPARASNRSSQSGASVPASPLGGTMDAPPNPAADTFAEEMALGTEQPSTSPTDRVREDLPVERSDRSISSSGSISGSSKSTSGSSGSSAASQVKDEVSSVSDKAPAAAGKVKEWVSAHPLVAIGAGLVGGIVLGGRGGGGKSSHHHHYYGGQESPPSQESGSGSHSSSGQASQRQQGSGGLAGLIQQTGLLATVTKSAEGMMGMVNDHAAEVLRQRVPGFDDELRQKKGQAAPPPARMNATVPPPR